ncbi:transcriptional regulator, AraC family [Staphylococcus aureus subsp. aureus CIG1213]|nr:transcriptional regulator, AraC family [Staphylococcus aureus subsp. aureus CIG1213]
MTDNYSLHIYKSMKMSSVKEANLKIIYWLQGTGVVSINLQQYDDMFISRKALTPVFSSVL